MELFINVVHEHLRMSINRTSRKEWKAISTGVFTWEDGERTDSKRILCLLLYQSLYLGVSLSSLLDRDCDESRQVSSAELSR